MKVEKGSGWSELKSFLERFMQNTNKVVPTIQSESSSIRSEMQSVAPVRTGFLRSHITNKNVADGAEISSEAPYSGFVEFGTSRMTPRTFFRPALILGWEKIKKTLIRVLHI